MLRVVLDASEGCTSDAALEALAGIAISLSSASRVLCALGAGVSTAAGIPDFRTPRSPSTGVPSSSSSRLPPPLSVQATKRLFTYAALLHPDSRAAHLRFMAQLRRIVRRAGTASSGELEPHLAGSRKGKERAQEEPQPATAFHALLRALDATGRLRRVYTQNIDGLERRAGLGVVDLAHDGTMGGAAVATGRDSDAGSDGSEWGMGSTVVRDDGRRRGGCAGAAGVVVPLHGGLDEVVCGACGWREGWRRRHSKAFRKGRTVECGRCQKRADSRHRRSKRAIPLPPLAFLRPAVLLYDDPHSSTSFTSSLIASVAEADLDDEPDFLVVAGTSLRIPGFKRLVRQFAARVSRNGGLCVLINRGAVGKEWDKIFDYHVVGETDGFAQHTLSFLDAFTTPAPAVDQCSPTPSPFLPLPTRPAFYTPSPMPSTSSANLSIPPTPPHTSPLLPPSLLPASPRPFKPAKRARSSGRSSGGSDSGGSSSSTIPDRASEQGEHALASPPPSSALVRSIPLPAFHQGGAPASRLKRRRAENARAEPPLQSQGGMGAAELLKRVEARARREREERRRVRRAQKAKRVAGS
ncbi:hypothetical protein JCM3770_006826 [Rhodotorula araucariae]